MVADVDITYTPCPIAGPGSDLRPGCSLGLVGECDCALLGKSLIEGCLPPASGPGYGQRAWNDHVRVSWKRYTVRMVIALTQSWSVVNCIACMEGARHAYDPE